jgi:ATP-dependent phosphofructokinase / diphosphate-dependent phosphofructokinase
MAGESIRRVGIIFSGGPAPAANAVIAAAATSFLEDGRDVLGFFHGYSNLQDYDPETNPLVEGEHYRVFSEGDLRGLRNQRGIAIGTARANPGKGIVTRADLADPRKTEHLKRVHAALVSVGVDAIISIGGDDTLKTANLFYELQDHMPAGTKRIRIVHLPKTIDNDYKGIDFTFGFFTAVDFMAQELMNLRADALATSGYFIVEAMGRKAGWLAYGVAIAGEAHLVVGVEDIRGELCIEETTQDPETGESRTQKKLSLEALVDLIVDLMLKREERKKHYGVVVLAEGLAEKLADRYVRHVPRDEHGHISLGKVDLAELVSGAVASRFEARTERKKKLTGVRLGYEARCAPPHAFDVILGSQLGVGSYRGLVELELDGHMVSVSGQVQLRFVPFGELINPDTLMAETRYIDPDSDFHRLARILETRLDSIHDWLPIPRSERRGE